MKFGLSGSKEELNNSPKYSEGFSRFLRPQAISRVADYYFLPHLDKRNGKVLLRPLLGK